MYTHTTAAPSRKPAAGSGSTGGTNALRTQGAVFAFGTVLIDIGKGALAAWLAWLKSLLLLPRDPEVQPSPEELALRLQLRLQRLGAMREAGARLMARDRLGRDVFPRGAPEGLRTERQVRWQCDLFALMQAYGHVQHRGRPVVHMVRARPVMTLEAAIARVESLIGAAIDWTELRLFLPPQEAGADITINSREAPDALAAYGAEKGTFDVLFECSGASAVQSTG